jgi:hypothetical protein
MQDHVLLFKKHTIFQNYSKFMLSHLNCLGQV